tara:strand:- start:16 stop:1710 length:1695 start_codon:yes stop_codon:yes gene_type:complete
MKIIKKYLSILDSLNKKKFWLLVYLIALTLVLEVISIGSLLPFFKTILSENNGNIFYTLFSYFNLDKENLIYFSIIFLGSIFLIKTIFVSYIIYLKHKFIFELSCSLSKRILVNYQKYPIRKNLISKNADVQRLILIDVSMTSGGILQMCNAFSEIIILFAALSILIYIEPIIITFFIFLSLIIFFIYKIFYKAKIINWGEMRKTYDTNRRSHIVDLLNTLVFSKLIGIKNYILDLYDSSNIKTNYYYQLRERWNEIPRTLLEFIAILFLLIMFCYFYLEGYSFENIVPILGIFTLASLKIIISLNRLIVSINQILFCVPALERVAIDINQNVFDTKKIISSKNSKFNNIKFKNVYFKYNKKEIFKNLNFIINKKDFVGIYGPSGSGKSTLLSLIMGVLEPSNGNIYINGKDIKKFRFKIGYVGQSHNLTENSIAENIAFGEKKEKINLNKIDKVLTSLGLKEFIKNLPNKLDTIISEKSSNLSVGQAQRLVIARALYFEPDILVFDEPTSSLDIKNEKEVIKMIQEFSKTKTVFIVSHKKKNLSYCNKIISINKNLFKINKKL